MSEEVQQNPLSETAIVIVNWNGGEALGLLLEHLKPFSADLARIIVVDNASTDQSDVLARNSQICEVVRFRTNRGFGVAANEGVARSRSNFVLLLNPDVRLTQPSLTRLVDVANRHRFAGIVTGPLMSPDQTPQAAFQLRTLPSFWSALSDVVFLDELLEKIRPEPPVSFPTQLVTVEQPAAAYWLIRKKCWEELDGFDSMFRPAWFEDVDLCRRLSETEWEILFEPAAPAVHSGGYSLEVLGYRSFIRIYYRNMWRYFWRHSPLSALLLWLPLQFGVVVRLLLRPRKP